MKKTVPYLIIIFLSCIYLLVVKPYNLGISPDSVKYIEIAKSINEGKGIVIDGEVITHYPPGYPILLSLASKITGLEILQVGKFVNLFLFIILGIVFKTILDTLNFKDNIKNFLMATLLVSLPISVSLYFWSELLFIVCLALTYLFFMKWKHNNNHTLLFISGCFTLLAFMTRYAAAGFILGFFLIIVLPKGRKLSRKLIDLVYFFTPITMGTSFWLYYTAVNANSATNRSFVIHIIPLKKITASLKDLAAIITNSYLASIALLLFLLASIYFLYKNKLHIAGYLKKVKTDTNPIFVLIITYVFFIVFSISFLDAHIPLNNRMLSPVFIFTLLILGYMISHLNLLSYKLNRNLILSLILCLSFGISLHKWTDHFNNGYGYSGKNFAPYFNIIQEEVSPHKGVIYSNGLDLIKLASNQPLTLKSLPVKTDPGTNKNNKNYSLEFNEMKTDVFNNDALIVYFEKINWRWYLIDKQALIDSMKYQNIQTFKDGFFMSSLTKQKSQ